MLFVKQIDIKQKTIEKKEKKYCIVFDVFDYIQQYDRKCHTKYVHIIKKKLSWLLYDVYHLACVFMNYYK